MGIPGLRGNLVEKLVDLEAELGKNKDIVTNLKENWSHA
jgi:hypothetical protein